MQHINRVILNPLFLVSFTGTAILSIGITILGLLGWGLFASTWFLSAACLYFFGIFFYTIARNLPLNEKLEKRVPEEASAFWHLYLKDWTRESGDGSRLSGVTLRRVRRAHRSQAQGLCFATKGRESPFDAFCLLPPSRLASRPEGRHLAA